MSYAVGVIYYSVTTIFSNDSTYGVSSVTASAFVSPALSVSASLYLLFVLPTTGVLMPKFPIYIPGVSN